MGDMHKATAFLLGQQPKGPWRVALKGDGVDFCPAVFKDEADLDAWILEHEGSCNLWWQVNRSRGDFKKARSTKAAIGEVTNFYVDIDPPGDVIDLDEWVIGTLQNLRGLKPAPTFIINSGHGLQAFFTLDPPIPVMDAGHASDLESYSQKIADQLHGDSCFDLPRVLRLPFTTNFPDKGKLKNHPN
jgi:hypothetical protein